MKDLEKEKEEMRRQMDEEKPVDEEKPSQTGEGEVITDSAFNALKVGKYKVYSIAIVRLHGRIKQYMYYF